MGVSCRGCKKKKLFFAFIESRLEESQTLKDDLEQHAEILKANFQLFKTMLDEWSPDERQ